MKGGAKLKLALGLLVSVAALVLLLRGIDGAALVRAASRLSAGGCCWRWACWPPATRCAWCAGGGCWPRSIAGCGCATASRRSWPASR
jgi:hypothetical protein